VIVPILAFANYLLDLPANADFGLDTVPSVPKFAAIMLFCALCDDCAIYWSHRLMHTKWIYTHVHKLHHRHTYTLWYSASATHPAEFIFGNALPSTSGVLLLGRHIHVTAAIGWLFSRSLQNLQGHSGYQFSWNPFKVLPFTPGIAYHNFHHSFNIGNYCGYFQFWDTLCGTNEAYKQHVKKLKQHKDD